MVLKFLGKVLRTISEFPYGSTFVAVDLRILASVRFESKVRLFLLLVLDQAQSQKNSGSSGLTLNWKIMRK